MKGSLKEKQAMGRQVPSTRVRCNQETVEVGVAVQVYLLLRLEKLNKSIINVIRAVGGAVRVGTETNGHGKGTKVVGVKIAPKDIPVEVVVDLGVGKIKNIVNLFFSVFLCFAGDVGAPFWHFIIEILCFRYEARGKKRLQRVKVKD